MKETPEERYWSRRYAHGRLSGGYEKEWKWSVIDEFLPHVDHVIDLGCGDLRLWEGRDCEDYTGIDIAKNIVEKNRTKHPKWRFIHSPAEKRIPGLKKPVVICVSLLFHIMCTDRYVRILENLCAYSSEWILIHTWINNPFGSREKGPFTDGVYQYFRRFEDYLHILEKAGFALVALERNPNRVGAFYILRKKVTKRFSPQSP